MALVASTQMTFRRWRTLSQQWWTNSKSPKPWWGPVGRLGNGPFNAGKCLATRLPFFSPPHCNCRHCQTDNWSVCYFMILFSVLPLCNLSNLSALVNRWLWLADRGWHGRWSPPYPHVISCWVLVLGRRTLERFVDHSLGMRGAFSCVMPGACLPVLLNAVLWRLPDSFHLQWFQEKP
jgi:hypothetical protein